MRNFHPKELIDLAEEFSNTKNTNSVLTKILERIYHERNENTEYARTKVKERANNINYMIKRIA